MEWLIWLLVILGALICAMATGAPIAFCFMLINVVGVFFFWGGTAGLTQLVLSIQSGVATFILLPVPLFIFMGEAMFITGIGSRMIDTVDKFIGSRVPGRLALLTVAGGVLFGALSGASIASTAMMGSVMTPEMEKRGYGKVLSLGTAMASGGLDIMVPPSALAVLLCAIAYISIGKTLIATIIPGLLMAFIYLVYIFGRIYLQPSIAPAYEAPSVPMAEKLKEIVFYVLPLGLIIFAVIGTIYLGVAGPTESASLGAVATLILAACYKRLTWKTFKQSVMATTEITVQVLMIISGAIAFSQIMAFSGASRGLAEFTVGLPVAPMLIIAGMVLVGLLLGCFLEPASIMMITLPVFMPIVTGLGFDTVWFGVVFLVVIETGMLTPPFGLCLFVMKGVAPPGNTMGDIIRAALPFVICNLVSVALIMAFPQIALLLPSLMRR